MARKMLPLGIEDFVEMRTDDYYYIDKSVAIQDLLDNRYKVTLFARPRRFGKTLTMSMLKEFFEKKEPNNAHLFQGLAIERAGTPYWEHHQRYPVLFLSLRSIEGDSFAKARTKLAQCISMEAARHRELESSSALAKEEVSLYMRLREQTATEEELSSSLLQLSNMLAKHHGEKTIILIDEYDVPWDKAFIGGYYAEMTSFIRAFLGEALKTNLALHFAVLTGCLRVSRESIFTGLNNFIVRSIRDLEYRDIFGFTRNEVECLLADYGVAHRIDDATAWYNGYHFKNLEMYNPCDILNFCNDVKNDPHALPQSYWINTSSNDFILRFIRNANASMREEIERLIDGHTIMKSIRTDLTYGEIDDDPDNLWSFLLMTGYLTIEGEDNGERVVPLRIPNAEVRDIFIEKIAIWFRERMRTLDMRPLYAAILEGDARTLETRLRALLLDTISYHDSHENFYHGFLVGVLRGCDDWRMSSNPESGHGRGDILLEGRDARRGAVIELKSVSTAKEMEGACHKAIEQIREKRYAYPLEARGYEEIWLYGVAFCGKICKVVGERAEAAPSA